MNPPSVAVPYTGRFAPSPTGPLHAGSLVAALASWLDARAHGGRWLVRMEDVDTPRCVPGADQLILGQLAALGLVSDGPVLWQSTRGAAYAQALAGLTQSGRAYACGCSRQTIADESMAHGLSADRHAGRAYPGTCRPERGGLGSKPARAWRLHVGEGCEATTVTWFDRRLGHQTQDVERTVGDFVLKRADGLWAYQLAVVVDDAHQGVSDVVRGEDLLDNTPRQRLLQQALGLPPPRTLHVALALASDGSKLGKRHGAAALALSEVRERMAALGAAARHLALPAVLHQPPPDMTAGDWLAAAVAAWAERFGPETAAPRNVVGHALHAPARRDDDARR